MKRFGAIILALAVLLVAGCGGGIRNISVTSFRLASVNLQGLSGITALAEVGIHNPSAGFEVTDIRAVIRMDGEPFAVLTSDSLAIEGRSDKVYELPVTGRMAGGFNPLHLLRMAGGDWDSGRMTVDVTARVSFRGGVGKNVEYKDIPLDTLMEKFAI